MTDRYEIPTAELAPPPRASKGEGAHGRREPLRPPEQAIVAMPRGCGWRYRWRFFDGTQSAWRDAPTDRSFVHMPPAATGMEIEKPELAAANNTVGTPTGNLPAAVGCTEAARAALFVVPDDLKWPVDPDHRL